MFARCTCLGIAATIAIGCAHTAPRELVDARAAYERASVGPAARFDPAALRVAQESLANAEHAYRDRGDDDITRDLAYSAQRRAELAEAAGRIRAAAHAREEADEKVRTTSAQIEARRAEEAIPAEVKKQMEAERLAILEQQAEIARANTRRTQAEERMEQARRESSRLARVTHETRGDVYTIDSADLFEPFKATLLGEAVTKLGSLADAIHGAHPTAMLRVEGYTDDKATDDASKWITQQRAEAVRDVLIDHGVAPDRVAALGMGESRPVASNGSEEGRRANRRIEIVVIDNK